MAGRGRTKKVAQGESETAMLQELDTLKRLLMLQLVASGVKPIDIAQVLGVTKSAISEMIPVRKLSFGKKRTEEDSPGS